MSKKGEMKKGIEGDERRDEKKEKKEMKEVGKGERVLIHDITCMHNL